jgi:ABC-2 type transport system ATP-binding protein
MSTDVLLVEARNITVRFGSLVALNDVSYRFAGTGVCGLIGVNGAGKTTFIHTLIGLLPPTSGVVASGTGGLEVIAYCPDTPSFEPYLTAREVVAQSARLGRGSKVTRDESERCLNQVGLEGAAERQVGGFSRGMRQRLGIAAALVRAPRLLILDEPTSALDPIGREDVLRLATELGKELRVIFSSHILEDVDQIANDLVVLNRGQLVYAGPKENFGSEDRETAEFSVSLTRGTEHLTSWLRDNGLTWRSEGEEILLPDTAMVEVLGFFREHHDLLRVLKTGPGPSLQRTFMESLS